MTTAEQLSILVQKGKAKDVAALCQQSLDEGADVQQLLNEGLLAGMSEIGEKFKNNQVYVPEVLIAARALNKGLDVLRPALVETGAKPVGKAVIGTVQGDQHDIGKNLVAMMLVGAGFEVIDLGVNVPTERFVAAVEEQKPDLLLLSALLTTTMPNQGAVIERLKERGLRESVRVMVGGAPVTQEWADQIGADSYTPDAASAAERAKELIAG